MSRGESPLNNIKELTAKILAFVDERNWRQFHSPKDLAISVSIESAELPECFQWDRDTPTLDIQREIADICIYLLELADTLGIDIKAAIEEKLVINAERYPKEKSWGSSKKYDEI